VEIEDDAMVSIASVVSPAWPRLWTRGRRYLLKISDPEGDLLFGRKFQGPLGRCWSGHCGVARVADMDHKRNASIASAMSGAGSDFMSAEDDEPVTLEGSPLPLASPRAEVVRMKGACRL
tara:strand:- start:887 stop:1246 length:360 start_codon:yes stop_codon:yes gene_type:complete